MGAIDEVFGAVLAGVILNAWIFGLIFEGNDQLTPAQVAWMWYDIGFEKSDARINFNKLKPVTALQCLILAFLQLGFGLATMSEAFHLVVLSRFTSVSWVAVTWLSFAAACDILIAVTQVVYLHRHRSGIPATNHLIKILTLYIMSTGLLTGIVAILELTTFAALGFNFVHVFLSIAMGAIYCVSFLANLDARRIVRDAHTDPATFDLDNIRTEHKQNGTLKIMFKKRTMKTEGTGGMTGMDESFPSTTTKLSDLHVHPKTLKEQAASQGSDFESV
ncbi:hypothetical protein H0H92_013373 [Tricholoma furcatifolium]|nr:hypothetical protein H0H92_013373 [Tricholoma furcatifolium]